MTDLDGKEALFSFCRLRQAAVNEDLLRQTQKRLTLSDEELEEGHDKNLFLSASGRISFLAMATPISANFSFEQNVQNNGQREQPLWFSSAEQLLEHATQNWRSNFVTRDLNTVELLQGFLKRPFFMLVGVDAPLMTRFRRAQM